LAARLPRELKVGDSKQHNATKFFLVQKIAWVLTFWNFELSAIIFSHTFYVKTLKPLLIHLLRSACISIWMSMSKKIL
jgi:hypothetical protein